MLFDRSNEENLKFALEKSYHKSIVEAHAQQAAEINIVCNLNLYYLEDVECNSSSSRTGEYEITNSLKFEKFSMIKPRLCKPTLNTSHSSEISTNFLAIGRYFVRIRYQRVLFTNDAQLDLMLNASTLDKESIVDLSLLPLAIRAQLIYEYHTGSERVTQQCTINALAIDSHLLQIEINRKRDELIKEAIIRSSNPMDTEALLTSTAAKPSPELEEFIKSLEVDLNSYYICEKLAGNETQTVKESDLVKLNRLDALASFKCVQKYQSLFWNVIFADKDNKNFRRCPSALRWYERFKLHVCPKIILF